MNDQEEGAAVIMRERGSGKIRPGNKGPAGCVNTRPAGTYPTAPEGAMAMMPWVAAAHARAAYNISAQDPKSWEHIAHCTGGHELVYRLFDRSGRLLYIGITWSAGVRWRSHRKKHAWWPQVSRAVVECWGSNFLALTAELAAIKAERPEYNKRGAAAPRGGR